MGRYLNSKIEDRQDLRKKDSEIYRKMDKKLDGKIYNNTNIMIDRKFKKSQINRKIVKKMDSQI